MPELIILKKFISRQIHSLRKNANEIKNRVTKDIQITEEVKARFYSHWHYSAIRLLTDIDGLNNAKSIGRELNLETAYVAEILEFLTKHKLCKLEGGNFKLGAQSTHLESDSPWIFSRQLQWRQKAFQQMENTSSTDLFYTAPMVISEEDSNWIRHKILNLIREATEKARESKSEKLTCLNIDWFHLTKNKND